MGLDIDAWSHLTPYAGPPCANTHICQMAPEYQTALIPPARALGHIRLRTGLKDINEIREEFGMEPDRCYVGAAHYEENARNSVESSGSLVIHFTTPFSV
jgi:hypothetical protein